MKTWEQEFREEWKELVSLPWFEEFFDAWKSYDHWPATYILLTELQKTEGSKR